MNGIDLREENGQVQYLLKWIGYSDEDNTWEPQKNLNCIDLMAAFERKRKEEQKKKTKPVVGKKEKVKRPLVMEDCEIQQEEEKRPAKKKATEEVYIILKYLFLIVCLQFVKNDS